MEKEFMVNSPLRKENNINKMQYDPSLVTGQLLF